MPLSPRRGGCFVRSISSGNAIVPCWLLRAAARYERLVALRLQLQRRLSVWCASAVSASQLWQSLLQLSLGIPGGTVVGLHFIRFMLVGLHCLQPGPALNASTWQPGLHCRKSPSSSIWCWVWMWYGFCLLVLSLHNAIAWCRSGRVCEHSVPTA